jgi:hypothetical protein
MRTENTLSSHSIDIILQSMWSLWFRFFLPHYYHTEVRDLTVESRKTCFPFYHCTTCKNYIFRFKIHQKCPWNFKGQSAKARDLYIWNLGILVRNQRSKFVNGFFETSLLHEKFEGLSNKPIQARFDLYYRSSADKRNSFHTRAVLIA